MLTDVQKFCRDLDVEVRSLSLQSQLSHSDPNLYGNNRQSEGVSKSLMLSSLDNRGSRSSLECQDSRSCSQSTQSTSTSAEFSIDNTNSGYDVNLECSDEVLIQGEKECDLNSTFCEKDQGHDLGNSDNFKSVDSSEPSDNSCADNYSPGANLQKTMNSPEDENGSVFKSCTQTERTGTEEWGVPCSATTSGISVWEAEEEKRYFKAELSESDAGERSKLIGFISIF